MALASLSGFSPQLSDMQAAGVGWLFDAFYARWLGDALYGAEVRNWGAVFDVDAAAVGLGYTLDGFATKLGYASVIGLLLRVLGWILMERSYCNLMGMGVFSCLMG